MLASTCSASAKIELGSQQGTLILQSKPMLYEVSALATPVVQ